MVREQLTELAAEMVASVIEVSVSEGDRVEPDDTVVLLESMKMEIPVPAGTAGTVRRIAVSAGDVVQEGTVLLVLAP